MCDPIKLNLIKISSQSLVNLADKHIKKLSKKAFEDRPQILGVISIISHHLHIFSSQKTQRFGHALQFSFWYYFFVEIFV
jgi:hypothetical protein